MPIIQPGGKVLVTGANGFIGIWVTRTLLERGYSVRAVVRSEVKAVYLKTMFEERHGGRFEIAVVEDITSDGAFDEVVQGVDAIEHVASPFHFSAEDPNALIEPAVKGTTSIMQSAIKFGKELKRVVVTSSCVAIYHPSTNPNTFSELDWNHKAIERVNLLGKEATPVEKYGASKTLAEKAAWDLYNKHKDTLSWDLTVLNPSFVFGPFIHEVVNLDSLNTSTREWYNTVITGSKNEEALKKQGSSWVDVRDLAEAHALALEKPEAGGERIIISKESFIWQEWLNVANSLRPPPFTNKTLAEGNAENANNPVYPLSYVTTKQKRILGINFRAKEETARDLLTEFQEKGW